MFSLAFVPDGEAAVRAAPGADRGIPLTSGRNAWVSWTFAPETPTASGTPWASDRTWSLLPSLPPVNRIRPGQGALFFARTLAASTIALVQSASPRAPSSSSAAPYRRRQSPASVQAVNRLCALAGETPKEPGNICQAHPLVSTYTTAVNTARSSTGAVPPPCGRDLNPGNNGATSPHNSSGTSRRERASTTRPHHAASRDHHAR